MLSKRSDLPFWISVGATALLALMPRALAANSQETRLGTGLRMTRRRSGSRSSSEEPHEIERRRAHERGRGRHATHPLQIPWQGWKDILWRTYKEMQSDRLLSIAGGVAFFVLLAIFPAITALISAYGLFFNTSTITGNLSLLERRRAPNVLSIVTSRPTALPPTADARSRSALSSAFWCRYGAP